MRVTLYHSERVVLEHTIVHGSEIILQKHIARMYLRRREQDRAFSEGREAVPRKRQGAEVLPVMIQWHSGLRMKYSP